MTKGLPDILLYWDHVAWFYINTRWHNAFFDSVIPFLRNQWFWAPLYLFLLLFFPARFGKKGWQWCAGFIISFGLSDQLSATVMKPWFHRVRPCNNHWLAGLVHNIVPCGGGYSFPSSHAANHFALAVFMGITLGAGARWIWPAALIWAFVVAMSQVYVGVHFPLDVVCGAAVGSVCGLVAGTLFNRRYKLSWQ